MSQFRGAIVTGLLALMLMGAPNGLTAADWGRGDFSRAGCRRGDRIQIQDLDMSPDPVVEGQRLRSFRIRLRFEGNRECETEIEVREAGEVVARARRFALRPGINEIEVQPMESYRFNSREHCFNVVADLEGTRREIDAIRRFCARQRPSWTLREPGDRDRFNR